jgi:sulfatase modifying factor 1
MNKVFTSFLILLCGAYGCKFGSNDEGNTKKAIVAPDCSSKLPKRFGVMPSKSNITKGTSSDTGMVWIPEGDGKPGFWMDETEVTNAQFAKFVKATSYVTTAERVPKWEDLQKQLPPSTPKPPNSVFAAASLVFSAPRKAVYINNPGGWWVWTKGASWKHPQGPKSMLKGKENLPVVQVSWEDAVAYSKWAGKRLPTAAEWEKAAQGGKPNSKFPWGNEDIDNDKPKANTWQGEFPYTNTNRDGFYRAAPVRSFPANDYGLYDLAGNVWEWCADGENGEKAVKGGSFLCNASYCEGYRIEKKMTSSADTGLEHTGFRCVK